MSAIELDFLYWLDPSSNFAPVIMIPSARAARDIARQALKQNTHHGRITLWMWRHGKIKAAFAMARIRGEGGERPVRVIRAAPPFQDADKAEEVFKGERA